MSDRWFWFVACRKSGFVNCWFREEGYCQNPSHRRTAQDAEKKAA